MDHPGSHSRTSVIYNCKAGRSFGRDTRAEQRASRTPDQNPRDKHQHASDDDLKRRREKRRIHKAVADIGDGHELDRDHGDGDGGRGPEIGNEVGQRVTEPADRGHHPQIAPRTSGAPRPVSEPSSESASAKPMEMPAPTDAASPTRNVSHVLWVAKAAAKSGASVDTEPSISPASPGCTYCSRNMRRAVSSSLASALGVRICWPSLWARLSCSTSASASSSRSWRTEVSHVVSVARR